MNILTLDKIEKSYYNHKAVKGVSFEVPEGSVFGMLGPNGAGKTSTIRIITTITRADSGTILFQGQPLNSSHPALIGYMPEERGLYKKMQVGEILMYLAQLKGLTKSDAQKSMREWFERLNISDWEQKPIEELSKGMQQKVQFISTVIHRPKLLILDEPFSGLDPINAALIQAEIDELNRQGTTILFSTHRMEQVEQICDYIVLINKGENVLSGEVGEVKQRFKKNQFRVTYSGTLNLSAQPLPFSIVSQTQTKPNSNLWELVVQMPAGFSGMNLLEFLLNLPEKGFSILEFSELLPTFNQIFIQTVNSSNE
jgi:ABC-2 type transport system ATP-binding protein